MSTCLQVAALDAVALNLAPGLGTTSLYLLLLFFASDSKNSIDISHVSLRSSSGLAFLHFLAKPTCQSEEAQEAREWRGKGPGFAAKGVDKKKRRRRRRMSREN